MHTTILVNFQYDFGVALTEEITTIPIPKLSHGTIKPIKNKINFLKLHAYKSWIKQIAKVVRYIIS